MRNTSFSLIPEGRYPGRIISLTKRRAVTDGRSVDLLDFKIAIPLPGVASLTSAEAETNDHFVFWTIPASHSIAILINIPIPVFVTIRHAYLGRLIRNEVSDVTLLKKD